MKVLHLTLKKKWFDLIASGEKKEEYREIKPYWISRLTWHEFHKTVIDLETLEDVIFCHSRSCPDIDIINNRFYDYVHFKNGYGRAAGFLNVECRGIRIDEGKSEWGAEPGKKYFVISLGEIIK